ncbi:MAG: hypothetical protein LC112_11115 [Flavobacteriales bacterium]|nr:hypothetical protein [Flavobacteriales bacterium]
MYFLDNSFFTGDIFIPNLEETCIKNVEFYKLMSKWEKECLELVLGKCLSDELLSQFEIVTGENGKEYKLKIDADPKWSYLIDGRKYQSTDELVINFADLSAYGCGCYESKCTVHNWEGIVKEQTILLQGAEATFKESFLAYYVYFMWCFDNASKTTGVGEQMPEAKNSTGITNKAKRIAAWNYFYTWVRGCQKGGKIGLHLFIKEHAEAFESFEEICFKNQNIYGL